MTLADGILLLLVGLATGIVSGMFGLGGGVIMVPAMVLLLGYDQHLAEGTSLLVIIPTAAVGGYTHYRQGYVRVGPAVALGAGGILGALVGSTGALALGSTTLRHAFTGFLVAMAVRIMLPRRVPRRGEGPEPFP